MTIYTIYHVPNIKVGATDNLKTRMARYKSRYKEVEIEILLKMRFEQVPEYARWYIVGTYEWIFADMYGYPRGFHYYISRYSNRVKQSPYSTLEQIKSNYGKQHANDYFNQITVTNETLWKFLSLLLNQQSYIERLVKEIFPNSSPQSFPLALFLFTS
jgi:hypothetical protein